jgi:UDP-2,4-diacetamido-2,4,6-trideoxy-beta-L-altropyranose hydrolase
VTAPAVVVRADASAAIGLGHVSRCLSLAGAYTTATGGRVTLLSVDPLAGVQERAHAAGVTVRPLAAPPGSAADAAETAALARCEGASWIVLDGYHFDGAFQAALTGSGIRVLAFDDHGHAGRYAADLVLNQNAGADASAYADRAAGTRLLLGPRFAVLRDEFRTWSDPRPPAPRRARRILVTFGGSDPDNVSALVVAGLAHVPGPLDVVLLAGTANPHGEALAAVAAACPHPVELVVDAHDMARRLAWADLAIASAGGTSWELARMGTPHLAIVIADNQRPAARALARDGIALSLGWHADLDPGTIADAAAALVDDAGRRAELSRRGQLLIDSHGVTRVLAAMGLAGDARAAA